ncbi:hypothetical protein N7539_008689 [Penicillium diatomitis]|uniref:Uncharacterized protein n=1 Tax=Penicillium diatomitis TaxID=2819901 RepID=A0A9W9WR27_9EURO|nr:uncharacterized protein N7539_008689 [Penicillium diatomitis]KAJ5472120.1 hypothetical protein N7539_008689 [Penicillium diatomitis]
MYHSAADSKMYDPFASVTVNEQSTTDGTRAVSLSVASAERETQTDMASMLPPEAPQPPDPADLLADIQKAAEDVSQLVGRFGLKMAQILIASRTKEVLFKSDRSQMQLPCLGYADEFSCQLTKEYHEPIELEGEAPMLWWLWSPLLEWLSSTIGSSGCTLVFTPACKADVDLPDKFSIRLWSTTENTENIELTATYGGCFAERRIYDAPVARFCSRKQTFGSNTFTLSMDESQVPYEGASFEVAFDYLLPRTLSVWRGAMNILPNEEEQEQLVKALVGACEAKDDQMPLLEENDLQCRQLIRRLPPKARIWTVEAGLLGQDRVYAV